MLNRSHENVSVSEYGAMGVTKIRQDSGQKYAKLVRLAIPSRKVML